MNALRHLGMFHDWLSRTTFNLAACVLAFISAAYCYEVVSRYFFNAPTVWASPLVSYAICLTIFMALPELARQGLHISIDFHEGWSPSLVRALSIFTRLAAAAACLAAAWITGAQAWSEYLTGVWTNSYVAIPKWWLFVFIPYGFLSGGLHFLRGDAAPHADAEAAT